MDAWPSGHRLSLDAPTSARLQSQDSELQLVPKQVMHMLRPDLPDCLTGAGSAERQGPRAADDPAPARKGRPAAPQPAPGHEPPESHEPWESCPGASSHQQASGPQPSAAHASRLPWAELGGRGRAAAAPPRPQSSAPHACYAQAQRRPGSSQLQQPGVPQASAGQLLAACPSSKSGLVCSTR